MDYKVYKVDAPLFAMTAVIVVTAWEDDGEAKPLPTEAFHAESFLLKPGQTAFHCSARFEVSKGLFHEYNATLSSAGAALTVDKGFVEGEALNQARIDLALFLEAHTQTTQGIPFLGALDIKPTDISALVSILQREGGNHILESLEKETTNAHLQMIIQALRELRPFTKR